MIRETSDSETVQRNNWDVFSVKPISPPWPLAILLFCSCASSMGIYDKSSAQQNIRFGTQQLLMDSPYQGISCQEYGLGATLHSLCDLTQKKRSKCCTNFFVQLELSFTQWAHEYQIRELKLQGKRLKLQGKSLLLFTPKAKREKIDSFVKTLLTVFPVTWWAWPVQDTWEAFKNESAVPGVATSACTRKIKPQNVVCQNRKTSYTDWVNFVSACVS